MASEQRAEGLPEDSDVSGECSGRGHCPECAPEPEPRAEDVEVGLCRNGVRYSRHGPNDYDAYECEGCANCRFCDYRWLSPNPFGGVWTHACRLPYGHPEPHECAMDGAPHGV